MCVRVGWEVRARGVRGRWRALVCVERMALFMAVCIVGKAGPAVQDGLPIAFLVGARRSNACSWPCAQAFMVGAIIGVAFATVTMTIAACARRARARAAARAVERATEESRAAERRQQQQQQQQQQQHRGGTGDGGAAEEPSLTTPLLSENV